MIDNFVLLMIHVLLGLAGWRLILRDDLDQDPVIAPDEVPIAARVAEANRTVDANLPSVPKLKRLQVPRD